MDDPQARRVEELFDQAADLDPAQLITFLDEQCAGDADLRAPWRSFYSSTAGPRPPSRFSAAPWPSRARHCPRFRSPRFRPSPATACCALLGEGGMGTVYEAEQDNPRRTVALKLIRPGLVTPALLQRFAREAQILGRLHHPGIAQILRRRGRRRRPTVLRYGANLPACRSTSTPAEHALDLAGRLELIARVCDAVQHAHEQRRHPPRPQARQHPGGSAGQPKVLDFGVARAADLRTTTAHTRTGQLVGTLNYMSPEQIAADPRLDQRSDVYTLGVILFELLADRLPYPLEHLPLAEAARLIRERRARRGWAPSTARCRGDVETIAAKALEKDPDRRYPSAGELAADIRRHLGHEPIRARPPSALYQLGKFARRHKALVATTAAFLALLLGAGR